MRTTKYSKMVAWLIVNYEVRKKYIYINKSMSEKPIACKIVDMPEIKTEE